MLKIGDAVPDFHAQDQNGQNHSLADYKGKWTLVYFYPKDFTPGCTIEACSLRDHIEDLAQDGLDVVGVSADSVESHQKFTQRHQLPFTLLADPDKKLIKSFGVWQEKNLYGRKYMGIVRASFVIGSDLKIAMVWPKVSPLKHVAEVRAWLKQVR